MFYYINTSWWLYQWSSFIKNSIWDCVGRGHLWRVRIIRPATNHLVTTAKTDSAKTDNDQRLLLLHPHAYRDRHSSFSNRPNDNSSSKRSISDSLLFPAPVPPSEEHKVKAHAPVHIMDSDWRIWSRPSDTCPFKWYKGVKTQSQ